MGNESGPSAPFTLVQRIVETRSLDLYPNTFVGVKIHAGGGSTHM